MRASSSYSHDERDNDEALENLQDRVSFLKRVCFFPSLELKESKDHHNHKHYVILHCEMDCATDPNCLRKSSTLSIVKSFGLDEHRAMINCELFEKDFS